MLRIQVVYKALPSRLIITKVAKLVYLRYNLSSLVYLWNSIGEGCVHGPAAAFKRL
jgi:hypothetical protein